MEEIVRKFGVVVCSRSGSDIDRFIYESDLLSKYKVACLITDALTTYCCYFAADFSVSCLFIYLMCYYRFCMSKNCNIQKSIFTDLFM